MVREVSAELEEAFSLHQRHVTLGDLALSEKAIVDFVLHVDQGIAKAVNVIMHGGVLYASGRPRRRGPSRLGWRR